jgi:hypothetical protein
VLASIGFLLPEKPVRVFLHPDILHVLRDQSFSPLPTRVEDIRLSLTFEGNGYILGAGRRHMNDDRERTDRGRYTETVSPDDALSVFTDHEPRTAKEVATALDVSRRTALNKLDELVKRGDLRRKKVGGRAVVFWKPD